MLDPPNPSRSHAAAAARIAAAVWLVGAVIGVALEVWQQAIWAEREAGAELNAILEQLKLASWLNQATHFLSTATVAILASEWAHGRAMVRVGQGALGMSLLVGVWLLLVRLGQTSITEVESLSTISTVNGALFLGGLAAVLAPTRAPLVARVGFVGLAVAWLVYWNVVFDAAEPPLPPWLIMAIPLVMAGCWSAGLWLGAAHEVDEASEISAGSVVDDPSQLRAAQGIALLRAGMIARIVCSIASVASLVALGDAPGSASMVVWLAALGHCALAVALANAVNRYGSLPDRALERGHLTTVVACLAIGALLELYAASQAAALFDLAARASDGTSLWGMPGISEFEAMQSRAQWTGRIATLVGIVAAVSLGISLRQTALWLDDNRSSDRASTLVVMTILGGGGASVLLAAAQSGAIRDLGVMVAMMLASLTLAGAIGVMWLRLLGAVVRGLQTRPPA